MPPCVLRIRNSSRPRVAGSQPIPASCVRPKMSPLGAFSSIPSVRGRAPAGPAALVGTAKRVGSPSSNEVVSLIVKPARMSYAELANVTRWYGLQQRISMPRVQLLDLTLPSMAGNLALDEALLLEAESGNGAEVLRF